MPNDYRLIPPPQNYNIRKADEAQINESFRRLSADVKRIVNAVNQDRLLNPIPNTEDLSDLQSAANLYTTSAIAGAVGNKVPAASGLSGTFSGTNGVSFSILEWDDIDDDLRASLDGAKIWKANSAIDSNANFNANSAKAELVACIRTTKYTDLHVSGAGTFIYWVQWVNNYGEVSNVNNGVSVVIS